MDNVFIYHPVLDRTVSIPAKAAPAWCADGWQLVEDDNDPRAAKVIKSSAESELAAADAAAAETVAEAKATIVANTQPTAAPDETPSAEPGDAATTKKEKKLP